MSSTCGAGISQFALSSDRNVYPCADFCEDKKFSYGSVKEDFWDNMLNNQTWKELRYNYKNNILECKLCEFNKECSACCSARSYYNNSKIKSIDPVCEFNKLMIVFLREELSKKEIFTFG